MVQQCPNCGYEDTNRENKHGYDIPAVDTDHTSTDNWGDKSDFENSLVIDESTRKLCPNCKEEF